MPQLTRPGGLVIKASIRELHPQLPSQASSRLDTTKRAYSARMPTQC